uniref:Uncharacterized protein n=1 Tax=Aegilops tauschii TaxID=37682 RepID=M8B5Z5_AEGTA
MDVKLATIMFFVLLGCHVFSVHCGRQIDGGIGAKAYHGPPIVLCVKNTCAHHTCWCCATQWPGELCYDNLLPPFPNINLFRDCNK